MTGPAWVAYAQQKHKSRLEKNSRKEEAQRRTEEIMEKEFIMRHACITFNVALPPTTKVLRLINLRNLSKAICDRHNLDYKSEFRGHRNKATVWVKTMALIERCLLRPRGLSNLGDAALTTCPSSGNADRNEAESLGEADNGSVDEESDGGFTTGSSDTDESCTSSITDSEEVYNNIEIGSNVEVHGWIPRGGQESAASQYVVHSMNATHMVFVCESDQSKLCLTHQAIRGRIRFGKLKVRAENSEVELRVETATSCSQSIGAHAETNDECIEMGSSQTVVPIQRSIPSSHSRDEKSRDSLKSPTVGEDISLKICSLPSQGNLISDKIHFNACAGWLCFLCVLLETLYWCGAAKCSPLLSRFSGMFEILTRRDPTSPTIALSVIDDVANLLCDAEVIERGRWSCSERCLEAMLSSTKMPKLSEFEESLFSFRRERRYICKCGKYENAGHPSEEIPIHGMQLGAVEHFGYGDRRCTWDLQESVKRWWVHWNSAHEFTSRKAVGSAQDEIVIPDDDGSPEVGRVQKTCNCGLSPIGRAYRIVQLPKFILLSFADTDNSARTRSVRGKKVVVPSELLVGVMTYKLLARCYCTDPNGTHFWVETCVRDRAPLRSSVYSFDGEGTYATPVDHFEREVSRLTTKGPRALTAWLFYGAEE